jgi:molecular chaperone GrpE
MAKKKEAPDNNSAPNGKPAPEPAEEKAAEEFIEPDLTAGLQKELNTEKDRYLRLAADYDNYRKRSQREREALFQDVRADTIS